MIESSESCYTDDFSRVFPFGSLDMALLKNEAILDQITNNTKITEGNQRNKERRSKTCFEDIIRSEKKTEECTRIEPEKGGEGR